MTTWIEDPLILLRNNNLSKLWPCSSMNKEEKFNAMTRLIIALTIIGYMTTMRKSVILLGIIFIGILVYIHLNNTSVPKEGFDGFSSIRLDKTLPTIKNPLMNVLPADILDNPTRPEANKAYNPETVEKIDDKTKKFIVDEFKENDKLNEDSKNFISNASIDNINDKLFRDIGDTWDFDKSMRNWYTTPNTQIPNDQKSFTDFCYGNMKSCKDGDMISCISPGSNPPRWTEGGNP